jgi:hypothetical protein
MVTLFDLVPVVLSTAETCSGVVIQNVSVKKCKKKKAKFNFEILF